MDAPRPHPTSTTVTPLDLLGHAFKSRDPCGATLLRSQELFIDHPGQALQAIEEGLAQAPGEIYDWPEGP